MTIKGEKDCLLLCLLFMYFLSNIAPSDLLNCGGLWGPRPPQKKKNKKIALEMVDFQDIIFPSVLVNSGYLCNEKII